MNKTVKKSLALIALLLATTTATAQTPVLKKPVVLAPQVKPALPPAVLKAPITVVNAAGIASNSPSRGEAARRLKAQSIPVAAAFAALRNAFPDPNALSNIQIFRATRTPADVMAAFANAESNILALRAAGYATPDLMVVLKQAVSPSATSMMLAMDTLGVPATEWAPSIRQLYTLDFDALLAGLRSATNDKEWFGYALDVMGYNVQQMAETGYRHFNGGFSSPNSRGQPYPGPGELYSLLKYQVPLAEHLQVNDYALWVTMMNAGYSPVLMMSEIKMGTYDHLGRPSDAVSRCAMTTNLVNEGRHNGVSINPVLFIRIAPDGSASHSDAQRRCYVQFLEKLKDQSASRVFAGQLADFSIACMPADNPGCPAQRTEVAARMVTEARYPAEKN